MCLARASSGFCLLYMALLSLGWYSSALGVPWVLLAVLRYFWYSLGASGGPWVLLVFLGCL
jgi:hypothetical protein